MFVDLFYLFLSILFLLYIYLTWNNDYWLKQSIPFVEPKLFFGNIKDVIFLKKTIGEVYEDVYEKLSEKPLGGFFKLSQPILMIRHPDLIKVVLEDQFDNFHDNDIQVRKDIDKILKMNPFLATGNKWKTNRELLVKALKKDKMNNMFPLILEVNKEMIQFITNITNKSIDVQELGGKYVTDIVASFSFGQTNCNSFKKPNGEFRQICSQLFNTGFKSNLALLFAFYAPYLGSFFKYRIIKKQIAAFFIGIVTIVCKKRFREKQRRNDFLQELIDINKESEASGEGQVYNYDEITAACLSFLLNGYYTSAVSFSFTLFELAKNRHVQKKARQEILSIASNVSQFDFDTLSKLPYLDAVVSECLRLHPPIPAITRLCTKDTILKHKNFEYTIKSGTPVTIPISALHKDYRHFPYPDDMKPERFLNNKLNEDILYLPFGGGPRICPAITLSRGLIKLGIISILLHFDISLVEPITKLDLDTEKSFLRTAKGGIWLKFKNI